MDGLTRIGCYIVAISMAAFGIQYFIYVHSAPDLLNIPPYTVARPWSACLTGVVLVVSSLSFASGKKGVLTARLLGVALFLVFLICYVARILALLGRGSEILAMAATAFILAAAFPAEGDDFLPRPFDVGTTALAGRILFAVSLASFGIQHFMYHDYIASLIPAWIPARLFLAYFTGVAFLAAALSIASGKVTRLAGILLASMFLLWVAVLHCPRVAHALHNGDEWASLLMALLMGGAGFIFAGVFPEKH